MDPSEYQQQQQKLPSWIRPDAYGRPLAGVRSLRQQRILISLEERWTAAGRRELDPASLCFEDTEERVWDAASSRRTPGLWVQAGVCARSDAAEPSAFLSHPGSVVERPAEETRRRAERVVRSRAAASASAGLVREQPAAPL
eukprot:TRINITY_DN14112_c0_g1_i1.p3 TRINITY_DN14112_c0_g1~~TRINITY_DN14112_c0_g1_i1.p3  ORF type:complete len:142 (+),score=42.01 TRINITY_DN14112_c0_g1_i1:188-613(+)